MGYAEVIKALEKWHRLCGTPASAYRILPSALRLARSLIVRRKAARWEHPIAKKIFRLFYVPIYTLHLLFLDTSSIDTTNYIHILRSNLKTWIRLYTTFQRGHVLIQKT